MTDVATPSSRQSVPQLLRRAAQQNGKGIACIDKAKFTYNEILDRVKKLAGGLKNQIGLSRNGRVGILSLNSSKYFEYFFAVPWAGGYVVPLNIRLAPPEIKEILDDAQVEVLFVDAAFKSVAEALKDKMPSSFKAFIYCSEGSNDIAPAGWIDYESLVRENEALPHEDCDGGDCVYGLFYTGGTTGKSKGVMLSHASVILNALGNVMFVKFDDKTTYLHCAPMFHLADAQMTFAGTMGCSAHVFIPKFTPPDALKAIDAHKVTKAVLVPVMIQFCLSMPNVSTFQLQSLESVVYGGSPMAPSTLQMAMKYFPNAKFFQGYGMTECGPAICVLTSEYHQVGNPKMLSAGKPVAFAEVIIADENGNEVPRGTVGEILVRGAHTMIGYWNMPEATEKALRNGWMHTGDGGYMDEDGFVFICDRIKDMIISGGENVYSAEVEKAVQSFPGVDMVAVVGTPDEKYGELVTAVVTLKPDCKKELVTIEAIKDHCKDLIAGYKCPRKLIIKDKLPMSGAGKILKHEIRKEFWEGAEQSKIYGKDNKATSYS